ncbi:hypothetical protein OAP63_04485 [Vibrio sp.]|nr:hypothetical protein [Vibrio sp.]
MAIDRSVLIDLVKAGVQASSPDNSQPYRFYIGHDSILLSLDSNHLGMFFDANEYASLMSCGGVIENIKLTAMTHGLSTHIATLPMLAPDYKVAKLTFSIENVDVEPLSKAVFKRCTYRGVFKSGQTIPPNIVNNIESSISSFSGAYVHWFEGTSRDEVTRIISSTDRIRYLHKDLHHDFQSKLRFGREIETKRDGLAANTLGLESIFTATLPLLKSWTLMKALNFFGMEYFMAWRGATVPLKNATKICALVMPVNSDPLDQGAALHRLWMAINDNDNLHCQVFGALPLLIYRLTECGGKGFNTQQREFLTDYTNQLNELMNINPSENRVVIFFRIGYAKSDVCSSLRRPIETFLEN